MKKHSQQVSIGYNARLAVIILWGPRMDLPSNGYPKRSPGVWDGSLRAHGGDRNIGTP